MVRRILISSFAAVIAVAAPAQAQTSCATQGAAGVNCTPAGVEVSATVPHIIRLSVNPATAALTNPVESDFDGAGDALLENLGLHTLTLSANSDWTLTVASAATWSGTGNTGVGGKDIADLEWTSDAGSNWTAMSTTPTDVVPGSTAVANQGVTVGYRTAWTLASDSPGSYTLALTYRITAP